MRNAARSVSSHVFRVARMGNFSEQLSPEEFVEFESIRILFDCPPGMTLFVEEEMPKTVIFLLAGQVKLSMNSRAGRRVIFDVAYPGETLGLGSAFSGRRYDFTAETASPCKVASLACEDFLGFLKRHPSAYANVADEVCTECARACAKVRKLGLTVGAQAKLAEFLLEQRTLTEKTGCGTRVFCSFTHEEIGESIGVCRETVSRLLSDFKCRDLVESRGSTLVISDRRALEACAE
jgi:CRP-like cAMP-binding protein